VSDEVRYRFAKCFNCGLKVPLTWEQDNKLSELFKDDICPNCRSREWGIFRRDPMILAAEAARRGLLNLAGRLLRKRGS
jgi:hypothetical protein